MENPRNYFLHIVYHFGGELLKALQMCFLKKNLLNFCGNSTPKRELDFLVWGICKALSRVWCSRCCYNPRNAPHLRWTGLGENMFYQSGLLLRVTVPNRSTNRDCLKGNPATPLWNNTKSILLIYIISTNTICPNI